LHGIWQRRELEEEKEMMWYWKESEAGACPWEDYSTRLELGE
jgi:hypothetical protein